MHFTVSLLDYVVTFHTNEISICLREYRRSPATTNTLLKTERFTSIEVKNFPNPDYICTETNQNHYRISFKHGENQHYTCADVPPERFEAQMSTIHASYNPDWIAVDRLIDEDDWNYLALDLPSANSFEVFVRLARMFIVNKASGDQRILKLHYVIEKLIPQVFVYFRPKDGEKVGKLLSSTMPTVNQQALQAFSKPNLRRLRHMVNAKKEKDQKPAISQTSSKAHVDDDLLEVLKKMSAISLNDSLSIPSISIAFRSSSSETFESFSFPPFDMNPDLFTLIS